MFDFFSSPMNDKGKEVCSTKSSLVCSGSQRGSVVTFVEKEGVVVPKELAIAFDSAEGKVCLAGNNTVVAALAESFDKLVTSDNPCVSFTSSGGGSMKLLNDDQCNGILLSSEASDNVGKKRGDKKRGKARDNGNGNDNVNVNVNGNANANGSTVGKKHPRDPVPVAARTKQKQDDHKAKFSELLARHPFHPIPVGLPDGLGVVSTTIGNGFGNPRVRGYLFNRAGGSRVLRLSDFGIESGGGGRYSGSGVKLTGVLPAVKEMMDKFEFSLVAYQAFANNFTDRLNLHVALVVIIDGNAFYVFLCDDSAQHIRPLGLTKPYLKPAEKLIKNHGSSEPLPLPLKFAKMVIDNKEAMFPAELDLTNPDHLNMLNPNPNPKNKSKYVVDEMYFGNHMMANKFKMA
jgi:hypothetical protein